MPGKSSRVSEYLASLSADDRLKIAEASVATINSELVAAIADGDPVRVTVLTNRLKRTATEFSNNILLEIDAEEFVAYKAILEPIFKHIKNNYQEFRKRGKSEPESVRLTQADIDNFLTHEDVSSFLAAFSQLSFVKQNSLLSVRNIISRRDTSQLVLDVLGEYAGREPETLRKIMRPFMSKQNSLGLKTSIGIFLLFLVHSMVDKINRHQIVQSEDVKSTD